MQQTNIYIYIYIFTYLVFAPVAHLVRVLNSSKHLTGIHIIVTQTKCIGATQGSTGSSYVATAWLADKDRARPSSRHLMEKGKSPGKPRRGMYDGLSPGSDRVAPPARFTLPTEFPMTKFCGRGEARWGCGLVGAWTEAVIHLLMKFCRDVRLPGLFPFSLGVHIISYSIQ